jgi:hypothetical protein
VDEHDSASRQQRKRYRHAVGVVAVDVSIVNKVIDIDISNNSTKEVTYVKDVTDDGYIADVNKMKKIIDLNRYCYNYDLDVYIQNLFLSSYKLVFIIGRNYNFDSPYVDRQIVSKVVESGRNFHFNPTNFERRSLDDTMWSTRDGRVVVLREADRVFSPSVYFRVLSLGMLYFAGMIDDNRFRLSLYRMFGHLGLVVQIDLKISTCLRITILKMPDP